MDMLKCCRSDIFRRNRNRWQSSTKRCSISEEAYRNQLHTYIDRRRFSCDFTFQSFTNNDTINKSGTFTRKDKEEDGEDKDDTPVAPAVGVPHITTTDFVEVSYVPSTADLCIQLVNANWQTTQICLKRPTQAKYANAIKADLDILLEIRHPHVLLLMATTKMENYGIVSIFESVDYTLYDYLHKQEKRVPVHEIAKYARMLADALTYAHMRGYVHGALSSHYVYFVPNGDVKLGGWELAIHKDTPKSLLLNSRPKYEECLRAEIFRWQPPEFFNKREVRPESDVYGLCLLIWEMSTMQVPWSKYSERDLERHYCHWRHGVTVDIHNFPPLLYELLTIGLQTDADKRIMHMKMTYKFLVSIELQYESEKLLHVDEYRNDSNNNIFDIRSSRPRQVVRNRNSREITNAKV